MQFNTEFGLNTSLSVVSVSVKLIVANVQTGAACTRLWALTGGFLSAAPPEAAAMATGTNPCLGQRSPPPFLWGIGFTCLGMQRLLFNIPVSLSFLVQSEDCHVCHLFSLYPDIRLPSFQDVYSTELLYLQKRKALFQNLTSQLAAHCPVYLDGFLQHPNQCDTLHGQHSDRTPHIYIHIQSFSTN